MSLPPPRAGPSQPQQSWNGAASENTCATTATTTRASTSTDDSTNDNHTDDGGSTESPSLIRRLMQLLVPTAPQSKRSLALAATSALAVVALHKISRRLSTRWSGTYRSFGEGMKIEWDSHVVSLVNAILTSCAATYVIHKLRRMKNFDPVTFRSPLVSASFSVLLGYLAADLCIMLKNREHVKGLKMYIFHHLLGILGFVPALTKQSYFYYGVLWMFTESSTPFVNMRWFLSQLGYNKSSPLYLGNAIILMSMFFLVRICIVPYMTFSSLWVHRNHLLSQKERIMPLLVVSLSSLACFMNARWFMIMVAILRQMLQRRRTPISSRL